MYRTIPKLQMSDGESAFPVAITSGAVQNTNEDFIARLWFIISDRSQFCVIYRRMLTDNCAW